MGWHGRAGGRGRTQKKTDRAPARARELPRSRSPPPPRPVLHLSTLAHSLSIPSPPYHPLPTPPLSQAGLAGILGLAGSANVQGEDQKKLDILANEVFINMLKRSGQCAVLVSEEDEEAILVSPAAGDTAGDYCVVFDPLDGSSNIDCGVSIGTIYGIYKKRPGSPGELGDVLRPGRDMVAAGYCLYGSSCTMV